MLTKKAPEYLVALVADEQNRPRRKVNKHNLKVLRTSRKYGGDRAFCVSGPKLWNKLPCELKQCKSLCEFQKKAQNAPLYSVLWRLDCFPKYYFNLC